MTMLLFLLYSLVFWFAGVCFVRIMQYSIQQGQWFDLLFNWQVRLQNWSQSPKKWKQGLAKMGGDCSMCFSHILTVFNYVAYAIFMNLVLHIWVTDTITVKDGFGRIAAVIVVNLIWYVVFVCIGSILSLLMILKRKK